MEERLYSPKNSCVACSIPKHRRVQVPRKGFPDTLYIFDWDTFKRIPARYQPAGVFHSLCWGGPKPAALGNLAVICHE